MCYFVNQFVFGRNGDTLIWDIIRLPVIGRTWIYPKGTHSRTFSHKNTY